MAQASIGSADGQQSEDHPQAQLLGQELLLFFQQAAQGLHFDQDRRHQHQKKDWGYTTSAQSTAASGENIQLIEEGGAEIAIAMQDSVMQA